MTDDDPDLTAKSQHPAAPGAPTADSRDIERWLRESLRQDALRTAAKLGDLTRRVEREAPTFSPRLRSALEALQLLSGRLSLGIPHEDSDFAADARGPEPSERCKCAACIYLSRSRSASHGLDGDAGASADEVF